MDMNPQSQELQAIAEPGIVIVEHMSSRCKYFMRDRYVMCLCVCVGGATLRVACYSIHVASAKGFVELLRF